MNKKWHIFCLKAEGAVEEFFEKKFCKRFFAIQNNIPLVSIKFPSDLRGIECEPINGVSYQSKFFSSGFKSSEIIDSLEKIYKYHSDYYPSLKKVLFYTNLPISDTILNLQVGDINSTNNNQGKENVIKKLLDEKGIEVEFFYNIEDLVDLEDKYNDLKEYFIQSNDIQFLLDLIDRYIEKDLYLFTAKDLLESVSFEGLNSKQKYSYLTLKGKLNSYVQVYSLNKELGEKDFGKYFIQAFDYNKNDKGTLNKAVGYLCKFLETKELVFINDAKAIIDNLLNKGFNQDAHNVLLHIKFALYKNFTDLENSIPIQYLGNQETYSNLLGIASYSGNYDKVPYYYKLLEKPSIHNKIDFLNSKAQFIFSKYNINDLSLDGRKLFLELFNEINEDEELFKGKGLLVETVFYNLKGLVYCKLLGDLEKGIRYFDKSLELFEDDVVKANKGSCLRDLGKIDEAIKVFEEIYSNLKISLNKKGQFVEGHLILKQCPVILAECYSLKGDKQKSINTLNDFENKFKEFLDEETSLKLNLGKISCIDGQEKIQLITKLVDTNPNCFEYNICYYDISGDTTYIDNALSIFTSNYERHTNGPLILSDRLKKLERYEDQYNVLKIILVDFSQKILIRDFIEVLQILSKFDEIMDVIEKYKLHNGGKEDEFSLSYKVLIYEDMYDYDKGLSLLEHNKDITLSSAHLLLLKCIVLEKKGDSLKEIKKIIDFILENFDINNLGINEKINFLYFYKDIDSLDCIKKHYIFAQIEKNTNNQDLFFRYFTGLLFFSEQRNKNDILNLLSSPKIIDENSIFTLEETLSGDTYSYCIDGVTTIGNLANIKDIGITKEDFLSKGIGGNIVNKFNRT